MIYVVIRPQTPPSQRSKWSAATLIVQLDTNHGDWGEKQDPCQCSCSKSNTCGSLCKHKCPPSFPSLDTRPFWPRPEGSGVQSILPILSVPSFLTSPFSLSLPFPFPSPLPPPSLSQLVNLKAELFHKQREFRREKLATRDTSPKRVSEKVRL